MATHKCPFCGRKYIHKSGLYDHMDKDHKEELHSFPASQIYFNYRNRYALSKENGKCVMTGKPTRFNEITERYERFADEKAREAYREYFKKNMKKVYGVETLLNDMEQQKKMLANRKISGEYKWSNGHTTTYTGTYEKKFLEFLEEELNWDNPADVMGPAPMIFPFDLNGDKKVHIPDFYITSLNLIVNIKASTNQHYRLRDIETEKAQDEAIKRSEFNYIKLMDNDFDRLVEAISEIQKDDSPRSKKKLFI
jgi:hypothetical protein